MDPWGLQKKCNQEYIYRGDKRHPNIILSEGFQPLGNSKDLYLHALDNTSPPSNFISTSIDIEVASGFAARYETPGFVYAMKKPSSGLNVNEVLGKKTPFPDEIEIAVPGGIPAKDILGVTPVNADGSFVGFSFINFLRG